MKKISLIVCFIANLISCNILIGYADTGFHEPNSEIRAVWMVPRLLFDEDPDKGKMEVRKFVKKIADANFNVILAEMPSEYIAAITDDRYQKVIPIIKWDAIGELIKNSREAGIQVHIWYSFTDYKSPRSPEFNPVHNGNPEWAAVQIDELNMDRTSNVKSLRRMSVICPLHPEARHWELRLLGQVLQRYPLLSGVHIEEPGYGGRGDCVCDLCLKLYRDIYGIIGTPDVNGPQAEELKCLGTTEFMRQLRNQTKIKNPKILLSVNGGHSWQIDRHSGRNWKRWADLKWLDFYVPQIYTTDVNKLRDNAQTTVLALGNDCPVVVGIAVKWGLEERNRNSVETILKEIDIARRVGAKGVIIYKAEYLTNEYLSALKSGPFRDPAPLPKQED
jgi:uncharacterized lipoprotein YddW (UPF0748 family)